MFAKEADFAAFLELLAEALERFPVDLLAYCLMGNHWHLLLRPSIPAVDAGQVWVDAFNKWKAAAFSPGRSLIN